MDRGVNRFRFFPESKYENFRRVVDEGYAYRLLKNE